MSVTGHLRTNGFMDQKRSDGGGVPALLIRRPPSRTSMAGQSEHRQNTDGTETDRRAFWRQPVSEEKPMGLFSKEIATMDDLLLHGLKDVFYAENQIVKALPKMIDKATNRDLTKGLSQHLEETKKQIDRLEQVFRLLGAEPKGVKCPAINGLIDEADEVAGEGAAKDVLDAAIVGAAQAVEHYEMARYGTLIAWADELGRDDVARLLNTNLKEEKAADKKLSTIALRKGVNRKAAS